MKLRFALAAALAGTTSACGGKVIFDTASAGTGGAGGTSTHGVTATTTTAHGTSASTTHATTSQVSATTAGSTKASVSAVTTGGCDTGQPGDFGTAVCNNCASCAISNVCQASYSSFINNPDGKAFVDCTNGCASNQGCEQMCQQAHPQGAQLYFEVVSCVVCIGCPKNCNAPQNCMMTGG